jgi:DHA2 family multidrug resistance protein
MTGSTIAMGQGPMIVSGVIQGLGLGLVFVPLSTIAFATLEPRFRTDAASLFSLVRNLGSSVGISIVTTLAQNTQVNHASLAEHVTPFRLGLPSQVIEALGPAGGTQALAMLDAQVNQRAAMIAYLDDFKLMMFVTLAAIPLLLLLRTPRRQAGGGSATAAAAME